MQNVERSDYKVVITDSSIEYIKYWYLDNNIDIVNRKNVTVIVSAAIIQVDYYIDRYLNGIDRVETDKGSFTFFDKNNSTIESVISFVNTKLNS